MVATRQQKMEPTKATPRDRPNAGPQWQSPRTPLPQPSDFTAPKANLLEKAQAVAGIGATPEVVAAIIIAQACDRLGDKLVESAAVGRYRGV